MSVLPFLESLRHRDIELWIEGEQLRCKAPAGSLDAALRAELQRRKGDIVRFLNTAQNVAAQSSAIVPLQASGTLPPVFAVPGHSGDVFCFRALAQHLGDAQPFFGLQPPGLDGTGAPLTSVEALAAYFATQILAFRPLGPYIVAGYCAGGTVACELARQLMVRGAQIDCVALFGSPYPLWYRRWPQWRVRLAEQAARLKKHLRALATLSWSAWRTYVAEKLRERQERRETLRRAATDPARRTRAAVERATLEAVRRYAPKAYAGRIVVFLPNAEWRRPGNRLLRWPGAMARASEEYVGPDGCDGYSMLLEPHAAVFAAMFRHVAPARIVPPGQS